MLDILSASHKFDLSPPSHHRWLILGAFLNPGFFFLLKILLASESGFSWL